MYSTHNCQILMEPEFSPLSLKNPQISNFMKICPVGTKVFHENRWLDRQVESNSCFLPLCVCAWKWKREPSTPKWGTTSTTLYKLWAPPYTNYEHHPIQTTSTTLYKQHLVPICFIIRSRHIRWKVIHISSITVINMFTSSWTVSSYPHVSWQ